MLRNVTYLKPILAQKKRRGFLCRLELTVLLMNEDLFLTVHDVHNVNPDIAHVDYQQVRHFGFHHSVG